MTGPLMSNADLAPKRIWIAIAAAFLANSILFGTWAARLPAIKQRFDLSHDALGLLLLLMAAGAICGFPIAGKLADRHGGARITRILWALMVLSMLGLALAPGIWLLALAIICFGLSGGGMDVAMNVWATEAEDDTGKIWMPELSCHVEPWVRSGCAQRSGRYPLGLEPWHPLRHCRHAGPALGDLEHAHFPGRSPRNPQKRPLSCQS